MLHEYKIGDIIRIKQREGDPHDYPFAFGDYMSGLAGTICKIKEIIPIEHLSNPKSKYINGDYNMYTILPVNSLDSRDFVWGWHSSMFEPIEEIRQTLNLNDRVTFGTLIGEVSFLWIQDKKFFYIFFSGIHSDTCKSLHQLSWFEYLAKKYNAIEIERSTGFPKFHSLEDLDAFIKEANYYFSFPEKETSSKIDKQHENNEIKFQKPTASYVRGSIPKGNPICGRKHKTAIVVGCLSNQEISC